MNAAKTVAVASPGPWSYTPWDQIAQPEFAIHAADGTWVADAVLDHDSETMTGEIQEANARVIAAAQDTLGELEAIAEIVNESGKVTIERGSVWESRILAAIAKARGGID